MKEWECVEVKHHKDVGKTIEEYQREGWRLHTYQTAGMGVGLKFNSLSLQTKIHKQQNIRTPAPPRLPALYKYIETQHTQTQTE